MRRVVATLVARELGELERPARAWNNLTRWVVGEAGRRERGAQLLVERLAVAGDQILARDALRRILRMEVEREPLDLGAEPVP